MKKSITFAFLSLALTGVLAGCGSRGSKNIANVNGENISQDEFYRALDMTPTVRIMTPNGPTDARVATRLGYQVLQDLIKRKLTIQLAKDQGVAPTDKAIEEEIDFRSKLDPDFMKNQTRAGIVLSQTREDLRYQMSVENIITKGITVTKEEAKKYIADHPDQFMEPETADLLWILLKPGHESNRKVIDEALLAGQAFSSLASQYSDAPGVRESLGRFPQRYISAMPEALQKLIKETPESRVTKWIQSQEGWAKFSVEKKTPAKKLEMTTARIEDVRRRIAVDRGRGAHDINEQIAKKLESSEKTIKIDDKSLSELWAKSFEEYKKAASDKAKAAAKK